MDEQAFRSGLSNLLSFVQSQGIGSFSAEAKQALAQLLGSATQRLGKAKVEAPMPEGADLLWQIAGNNPDVFAQYLRQVPDPVLNNLLKNPTQFNQTVDRLQKAMPAPTGQPPRIDGVPKAPLQSSNVYGFQYDPQSQHLRVRFNKGGVYDYEGVPPYVYRIFQAGAVPAKTTGQNEFGQWWQGKNPSLGAAFYEMIKNGGYPYQRAA